MNQLDAVIHAFGQQAGQAEARSLFRQAVKLFREQGQSRPAGNDDHRPRAADGGDGFPAEPLQRIQLAGGKGAKAQCRRQARRQAGQPAGRHGLAPALWHWLGGQGVPAGENVQAVGNGDDCDHDRQHQSHRGHRVSQSHGPAQCRQHATQSCQRQEQGSFWSSQQQLQK